jgi:DnaJ-class molecular chaperone
MHRAYYDTLGVQTSATTEEIKRAYKKLALQKHPDKGGNEDEFKALGTAYKVLTDENTRRIYDQVGEEGLNGNSQSGFGNVNPHDIFAQFFGSDAGFGQFQGFNHHRSQQQPATVQPIECSLEELFAGCKKKVKITRKIAKGKTMSAPCSTCKGSGVVVHTVQMGHFLTQTQQHCDACGGRGVSKNKKLVDEILYIDLDIPRGTRNDTQMILKGKGNESPNSDDGECGDYILQIKQSDHARFKRENDDLVYPIAMTDVDLLTGAFVSIVHIDSASYSVDISKMTDLSKPYKIANMGMPRTEQPSESGDLFIRVTIEKTAISLDKRAQIRALLSLQPEPSPSTILNPVIFTRINQDGASRRNAHARPQQPENVQCAQQ